MRIFASHQINKAFCCRPRGRPTDGAHSACSARSRWTQGAPITGSRVSTTGDGISASTTRPPPWPWSRGGRRTRALSPGTGSSSILRGATSTSTPVSTRGSTGSLSSLASITSSRRHPKPRSSSTAPKRLTLVIMKSDPRSKLNLVTSMTLHLPVIERSQKLTKKRFYSNEH